ncbi:hypothetical protein Cob_v003181 [Colletotrichum orbiculare MAFF 240422]|uniref:Uncharacterized protein n=1 Tax=Colletotrichum orbiculare (strain 104-T / ATCC 96160 / CBS 514.97 / LARS 414 / MAFF 240422) TaxID=1213857 RepID=N4UQ74_COLOR|nr:hypothetical protein Cob_v003181 [Colletotrichum orbiculare MAFF 240422]
MPQDGAEFDEKSWQDLHLTLRPDDVGLVALVQLSFFVNVPGRAEELRSKFVEHQGRKHVMVDARPASLATVDASDVVDRLVQLVKGGLQDPEIRLLVQSPGIYGGQLRPAKRPGREGLRDVGGSRVR